MLAIGAFGYPLDYLLLCLLYVSILFHTWCFFRFFPKKRHRRIALILGNSLVLTCLLGSAALVSESYLRFLSVQTDSFGMSLPARRWFALYARLNELKCRDKEWALEKPAGLRRIAFVGDSFCYGWGIERVEDRYTNRIQRRFDQAAPGTVEIMNVAKPGWGTGDQIQPIEDMIGHFDVDEIVLCYVFNDIEKTLPITNDFDPTRPPEPSWFNPETSCLIDYLYRTLYVPRVATVSHYHDWLADGYGNERTWRAHEEQLGAIIQACRTGHVRLRAVLQPFLWTGGQKFDPQRIHAKVRDFLEANGVEVLDLLPVLADQDPTALMVNRQDPHPNVKAHALFAEAIWKAFFAPRAPADHEDVFAKPLSEPRP